MNREELLTCMTALRHYYSIQKAWFDIYRESSDHSMASSAKNFMDQAEKSYEKIKSELDTKLGVGDYPPILVEDTYQIIYDKYAV